MTSFLKEIYEIYQTYSTNKGFSSWMKKKKIIIIIIFLGWWQLFELSVFWIKCCFCPSITSHKYSWRWYFGEKNLSIWPKRFPVMNSTWMLCKSEKNKCSLVTVVTMDLVEWALIWSLSDHPTKEHEKCLETAISW